SVAIPITGAFGRPGYTGQYCEFREFEAVKSFVFHHIMRHNGYLTDVADMGNCTRSTEILVDETMTSIHFQIQSLDLVNPRFVVTDSKGNVGTPDGEMKKPDRYIAHFEKLSPGYYRVTGSADSISSHCLLQTTAHTAMTISGGFSSDDRD
ncbi:hypothetical protein PENTCL1PPCAC_30184, partial [Pristionchus entomophagus]